MVRRKVGLKYGELKFINHATHNHHGPDSAGLNPVYLLNRKYFAYMLDVMVKTTVEALENSEPAILRITQSKWLFGMSDGRDPRIRDDDLRIIQAVSVRNRRIITHIVQWSNHPEVTLGFNPKINPRDCEVLGKPNCQANGQYLSGDFIGVTERILRKKFGSTLCFLNGPICGINPLRARVWEVSERFPIVGDGDKFPDGATEIPRNFRKQFIIGRELAIKIEKSLQEQATILRPVEFKFTTQHFYSRNTNIRFRLAMAIVSPAANRSAASYTPRASYVCSDPLRPSDETCKEDGYTNVFNSDFPMFLRKGEFLKSVIHLVDFGPLKWITGPAEVSPELFIGLPADFGIKYYKNPNFHAVGENYTMPGHVLQFMKCQFCWFIGLGDDELGYMIPISDHRIKCPFSKIQCSKLRLTYHDSMSGVECKWIIENEKLAKEKYGNVYPEVLFLCRYGLIDQAQHHYEEVNGLGWDLAKDYIDGVRKLFAKIKE